jgi:hypothetical protein
VVDSVAAVVVVGRLIVWVVSGPTPEQPANRRAPPTAMAAPPSHRATIPVDWPYRRGKGLAGHIRRSGAPNRGGLVPAITGAEGDSEQVPNTCER